jgi:phage shock protein A
MKLSQRLRILFRSMLDDLFGEEAGLEAGERKPDWLVSSPARTIDSSEEYFQVWQAESQSHLGELQVELVNATARQKRAELSWQDAQQKAQSLDRAVDAALQAGQEVQARAAQKEALQGEARVQELGDLYQACIRLTERLQEAIHDQQQQLAKVQTEAKILEEREYSASVLEDLVRQQREETRRAADLQRELDERKEQIARREDRIAARQELSARTKG